MSFETLPGYDAWKSAVPDCDSDYEAGLAHFAPAVAELCTAGHSDCPHARWVDDEDGDGIFDGCELRVTDRFFLVIGDPEECREVRGLAENFNAAEYYADMDADSREDF